MSSPGTGNTQISQDMIAQLLTVNVRIGLGIPKLFDVSLLTHFPLATKQAGVADGGMVLVAMAVGVSVGVGVRVGVGVSVGVGVRVGVDVSVGVGVRVGVDVRVGVGVRVGPNNCPGSQAEISKPDKRRKTNMT
jgi:hypothetical protein